MNEEPKDDVRQSHVERLNDVKDFGSGDVATQLVDVYTAVDINPEQSKQCLRRIDLVLLPVMFISFALQYLDKACLTSAALFGIILDLDLYTM
jgi:hypothetical protein